MRKLALERGSFHEGVPAITVMGGVNELTNIHTMLSRVWGS